MKATTLRSKRLLSRYKRADKVCRELRHVVSKDAKVDGTNSDKLMGLLLSWMSAAGKDKYERP